MRTISDFTCLTRYAILDGVLINAREQEIEFDDFDDMFHGIAIMNKRNMEQISVKYVKKSEKRIVLFRTMNAK